MPKYFPAFALTGAILLGVASTSTQALAWGREGHQVVAALAWDYLTPDARQKIDLILKQDKDTLTPPDFLSRSTWPDAWRAAGHKETTEWHFVDIELEHPDLAQACYNFPQQTGLASSGPAKDCVVNKIPQFANELKDPKTPPAERVLALKYLVHFIGDLHQPLHAADNHDKGGNCVRLSLGGPRTTNLHSYWDTAIVSELDPSPASLADKLFMQITYDDKQAWQQGTAADWAQESFSLAQKYAYQLPVKPGCDPDSAPIELPPGYDAAAQSVARQQLMKAGVRLAYVLNNALSGTKTEQ
ncbi:S1/P1 nuclease [Acetobacter indonesiensis]|uniref:S1/P1 nuclease n=1 Tax=Acetobacter indonesiensis TaxID=104101 RepID=UPI0020A4F447|nr:S1/P1 nuclease [Acetobacter indonesiensis]MCP1231534.1 S1/P1 nuclease [Acetobacter indonesiensis]